MTDVSIVEQAGALQSLLEKTSRTFALVIPRLPEPTRSAVSVAYLFLRLADTIEDSERWPVPERGGALMTLAEALERSSGQLPALAGQWRDGGVTDDAGCLELLGEAETLLAVHRALGPAQRDIVTSHVVRSVRGMATLLHHAPPQGYQLSCEQELRDYCYVVAGIVGELLTKLFVADWPALRPVSSRLAADSAAFGEGLQLVNILKDAEEDERAGRRFLPSGVQPARVFARARDCLEGARRYVRVVDEAGAPEGVVAFVAIPAELAVATLDVVERSGAGAKLRRPQVAAIVAGVDERLARRGALRHDAPAAPSRVGR